MSGCHHGVTVAIASMCAIGAVFVVWTSQTGRDITVMQEKAEKAATFPGVGAVSLYSSHECRGQPVLTLSYKKKTNLVFHPNLTCQFTNICINFSARRKQLLYFSENASARLTIPRSLDLAPLATQGKGSMFVRIGSIPKEIPDRAMFFKVPTTILIQFFNAHNFGHLLADNMYSAYFMQRLFNVADPLNTQILQFFPCDVVSSDGINRTLCKQMISKMFFAISRHQVLELFSTEFLQFQGVTNVKSENLGLMCFQKMIVSPGANSFRLVGDQRFAHGHHLFWGFRLRLMQNLHVLQLPPAHPPNRIIIALKTDLDKVNTYRFSTGPGIQNAGALRSHLASKFPEYEVTSMDLARFAFKDQIFIMTRTRVLFSHSGGGSFSALFLSRDTTLALQKPKYEFELRFFRSLWFRVCQFSHNGIVQPSIGEIIVKDTNSTCGFGAD